MTRLKLQFILAILLIFGNTFLCRGSIQADTVSANMNFSKGDSLYNIHQIKSSNEHYEIAANIYKEAKNWKQYIKCSNHICENYRILGQYDTALERARQTLSLGLKYLGSSHTLVAGTLRQIGIIYNFLGSGEQSLLYIKKALEIKRAFFGENHLKMAGNYNDVALAYDHIGSHNQAFDYLKKTLKIYESQPKTVDEHNLSYYSAVAMTNIAYVLNHMQKYEESLEYSKKSLKIIRETVGVKDPNLALSLSDVGFAYYHLKSSDSALFYYQKALELRKEFYNENHALVAYDYTQIGNTYRELGTYDSAHFYHKKALEIYKRALSGKNDEKSRVYNNIAENYLKTGNYVRALTSLQQSLIGNVISFEDSSIYMNPRLENYLNQTFLLQTLEKKAQTLTKSYTKDRNIDNLKFSLKTYQLSDSLIDKVRQSHLQYEDKVAFGKTSSEVYQGAIQTCMLLYKTTNDNQYFDRAFYFSERNKAIVLSEGLLNQQAKKFANLPDTLLELEQSFKVNKASYYSRIQDMKVRKDGYDTANFDILENKLFSTTQRLDSLKLALEKNYTYYYQLKYQNSVLNPKLVQKSLSKNQALLSYFEGDSSFYVFRMTRGNFDIKTIKKNSILTSQVNQYIDSFDWSLILNKPDKAFAQFTNSSYAIYEQIVKPMVVGLNPNINQMTIIPDGKLSYVPWGLFIRDLPDQKDNINYKNLDYLFKDYSISYGHSASLLFQNFKLSEKKSAGSVLAFAPDYSDENNPNSYVALAPEFRDELVPLSWNKPELDEISKYFDGDFISSGQATEKSFKDLAGQHQILHLAMHALVDNENPMQSKLVFTQDSDSIEDGMLHTYELFNMDISAEMVVLSACNTGIGKLQKGEGVMSLGRAFSYAGCPSIVTSHWSVDDQSTSKLMGLFYKSLSEGQSKDIAMQQARKTFLSNASIKQHPVYWGGFVVMGDTAPLTSNRMWVFGIIGMAGIIAIFISFKKTFLKVN